MKFVLASLNFFGISKITCLYWHQVRAWLHDCMMMTFVECIIVWIMNMTRLSLLVNDYVYDDFYDDSSFADNHWYVQVASMSLLWWGLWWWWSDDDDDDDQMMMMMIVVLLKITDMTRLLQCLCWESFTGSPPNWRK